MKFWIEPNGEMIPVDHHSDLYDVELETNGDYARRTGNVRLLLNSETEKAYIVIWDGITPEQNETVQAVTEGFAVKISQVLETVEA